MDSEVINHTQAISATLPNLEPSSLLEKISLNLSRLQAISESFAEKNIEFDFTGSVNKLTSRAVLIAEKHLKEGLLLVSAIAGLTLDSSDKDSLLTTVGKVEAAGPRRISKKDRTPDELLIDNYLTNLRASIKSINEFKKTFTRTPIKKIENFCTLLKDELINKKSIADDLNKPALLEIDNLIEKKVSYLMRAFPQRVANERFLSTDGVNLKPELPMSLFSNELSLNNRLIELIGILKSSPGSLERKLNEYLGNISEADARFLKEELDLIARGRFETLKQTSKMLFMLAGQTERPRFFAEVAFNRRDPNDQVSVLRNSWENMPTEAFDKLTDEQMARLAPQEIVGAYLSTEFRLSSDPQGTAPVLIKGREKSFLKYFTKLFLNHMGAEIGSGGKIDNVELPLGVYDLIGCRVIFKTYKEVQEFAEKFTEVDPQTGAYQAVDLREKLTKENLAQLEITDKNCIVTPLQVKNYLSEPKENGYNRIHILIYWNGTPIELQVTTGQDEERNESTFQETNHQNHDNLEGKLDPERIKALEKIQLFINEKLLQFKEIYTGYSFHQEDDGSGPVVRWLRRFLRHNDPTFLGRE